MLYTCMLADTINSPQTKLRYPDGYFHDDAVKPLRRRLAQAQVYVLDRDASAMAAHVALSKPSSIIAALPWARLPFDTTWIEFANDDLRTAMAEFGSPNTPSPDAVTVIRRSGFLLRRDGDSLIGEYVHLDRTKDGLEIADVAPIQFRYDMGPKPTRDDAMPRFRAETHGATGRMKEHLRLITSDPSEIAASRELHERFTWIAHPDYGRVKANLHRMVGSARVAEIEEAQAREAYRLFTMEILPTLILLNCRNAVDAEIVPAPEKLNRKRIAAGKPPLVEHRIVKLHLTAAKKARIAAEGHGGRVTRGTLVEGHFKVRKTGVFWWSPHARAGYGAVTRTTIVTK